MDIQRLRNLTTGHLHTTLADMTEDLEYLIGEKGLSHHMLTRVKQAVKPYLEAQTVAYPRLWNGQCDPSHVGEIAIRPLTPEENREALAASRTKFMQEADVVQLLLVQNLLDEYGLQALELAEALKAEQEIVAKTGHLSAGTLADNYLLVKAESEAEIARLLSENEELRNQAQKDITKARSSAIRDCIAVLDRRGSGDIMWLYQGLRDLLSKSCETSALCEANEEWLK